MPLTSSSPYQAPGFGPLYSALIHEGDPLPSPCAISRSHCPPRGGRRGYEQGKRQLGWGRASTTTLQTEAPLSLKKKKNQFVNYLISFEMNFCLVNYMAPPLFYTFVFIDEISQ